jgi:hypothetical protein
MNRIYRIATIIPQASPESAKGYGNSVKPPYPIFSESRAKRDEAMDGSRLLETKPGGGGQLNPFHAVHPVKKDACFIDSTAWIPLRVVAFIGF